MASIRSAGLEVPPAMRPTQVESSLAEGARPAKSRYWRSTKASTVLNGGRAKADRAEAGPVPAALVAATVKRYSFPGVSPVIVAEVAVVPVLTVLTVVPAASA